MTRPRLWRRLRRAGGTRPGGRSKGFTLIEVLIAFAILAVAMTPLLGSFSTGFRSVKHAKAQSLAMLQAQSKLAAVGREIPLAEGTLSGDFGNGNRWLVTIGPHDAGQAGDHRSMLVGWDVEVKVLWGEADEERSLSLATLRLAVPE